MVVTLGGSRQVTAPFCGALRMQTGAAFCRPSSYMPFTHFVRTYLFAHNWCLPVTQREVHVLVPEIALEDLARVCASHCTQSSAHWRATMERQFHAFEIVAVVKLSCHHPYLLC